jgi:hypothetical protein
VSGETRLGPTEYAELVARVREAVAATVPPGASVLVVSRGDDALLDLRDRRAAHFPQAGDGGYAGHHPRDGASATAELERLRRGGAEYLVIPATARWWLDYYEELAVHLATHAELLADVPGACLVYRVGGTAEGTGGAAEAAQPGPVVSRPQAGRDQIEDYLRRLVPEDSRLVMLESEGDLAAVAGAHYLVVPRSSERWPERDEWIEERLGRRLRKVADQRHLCRVFEIGEPTEAG